LAFTPKPDAADVVGAPGPDVPGAPGALEVAGALDVGGALDEPDELLHAVTVPPSTKAASAAQVAGFEANFISLPSRTGEFSSIQRSAGRLTSDTVTADVRRAWSIRVSSKRFAKRFDAGI
jgi:hypothetical protein